MNKQQVIQALHQLLDQKVAVLRDNLANLTEARNNEDKCTVGDKYETGRAMTQMELEKAQVQLNKTEDLKSTLSKIDWQSTAQKVGFGSLVKTSQGTYFFAIAFGKIILDGQNIFCLSPVSPIGKMLSGKKCGEKIQFQGKVIQVKQII